mmetsp:Transcript_10360/g.10439  ORF Transcript_10360/g.10439 Transcript_10360/m.10439 type:complete len:269 (+) Transcript_10360:83-889(+)
MRSSLNSAAIAVTCLMLAAEVSAFQPAKLFQNNRKIIRLESNSNSEPSSLPAQELSDFSGQVTGLLNSYRVPAMLIAGAAYGGVFALPILLDDTMIKQFGKRTYILVGLATVCVELLATVIATLSIDKLNLRGTPVKKLIHTSTLEEFLEKNLDLEWTSLRVNFILGLVGFAVMCGMRAWLSLVCPIFAKVGLFLIITAVISMSAFINDTLGDTSLPALFWRYTVLVLERLKRGKIMFILSFLFTIYTMAYTTWAYNHTYHYLIRILK